MQRLYKNKNVRREFRNFFDSKFSFYVKKQHHGKYLEEENEKKFFHLILEDLYPYVYAEENRHDNNNSYFRLLKEMITISSPANVEKLFTT